MKCEIGDSEINGQGAICTEKISNEEIIIKDSIYIEYFNLFIEEIGKKVNHSDTPNARLIRNECECYDLVAIASIEIGEEITISYNDEYAPKIIEKYVP